MTDDWTEPHSWDGERSDHDRSEERWLQPWEGDPDHPWWWFVGIGPEYRFAFDESIWVGFGEPDFFSPRARFVSDRE